MVLEKINVIKRSMFVNNDRGTVFNDFILRTKYTCKHANAQNIMSFLTLGIHISLWSYGLVNTYFHFFPQRCLFFWAICMTTLNAFWYIFHNNRLSMFMVYLKLEMWDVMEWNGRHIRYLVYKKYTNILFALCLYM